MEKDEIIKFIRQKDYKLIKHIGQGGTGKTVLLKDEIIDEVFVCKKYSPYNKEDKEQYFKYFIDEIKILHCIYHKNIVRVFNYYLYPEVKTGYILMEFVNGATINEYLIRNPDTIEDVFKQTIEGFIYLEENRILHRDIRPENIIISENGIVKIIDFGFGKMIDFRNDDKSISLNWRYNPPKDFSDRIYDFKTEIYFVGKLFEEIIKEIDNFEFKYSKLVSRMISIRYQDRISSFFDIYREIINLSSSEFSFTYEEKIVYLNFARELLNTLHRFDDSTVYNNQIDTIIKNLEDLYKNSILEDTIQNNRKLIKIFHESSPIVMKQAFAFHSIAACVTLLYVPDFAEQ